MSGSSKQHLHAREAAEEEASETAESEREVYLRDGRRLAVSEVGGDQLVEIRSPSGLVEVRIQLTEQGPVLRMEAVRLAIKASETVAIEGKRVELGATETVAIAGATVDIDAEQDVEVDAKNDVRVVGKMIYLN